MLRTVESFPSFRRFMTSFRTRPLDLATEADFGALGRLPRQDLAHIEPHLLAAASLTLARCHNLVANRGLSAQLLGIISNCSTTKS